MVGRCGTLYGQVGRSTVREFKRVNSEKLKAAEAHFLQMYPDGFADEAMQSVRKKHNVDKLITYANETITKANCNRPEFIAEAVLNIISRSSMVSRFEKPPFKDFINSLSSPEKQAFAYAIEQRMFGRKAKGFDALVGMLAHFKLAKWSLVSAVPFYVAPRREVFVKPTTAKGIVKGLEVDLHYQARPTWAFYDGYRKLIVDVRKQVSPTLSPSNAALTGFLMMSL